MIISPSVELPVNIHASDATFETQFGTVSRPTHRNTSYAFFPPPRALLTAQSTRSSSIQLGPGEV